MGRAVPSPSVTGEDARPPASRADRRFRTAAITYALYGVVYWIGGMWLLSQGVGVMGARGDGGTTVALARWGLVGLVPLVAIPLLLSRRWSWFGGLVSRRAFAALVALLLAARAWKVAGVALRSDTASVAAPWGGSITFQAGAAVFLVVTLAALVAVAAAALTADRVSSASRPDVRDAA